ncbi:hypothetical protein [Zavarzinella formosa]|uniref:hypothetical protein n=1 Tax=Zavarzinella formosa TaxID=360055 RepID=UPI00037FD9B3|nr:hypothetical protein [Zavarzinella formosa]
MDNSSPSPADPVGIRHQPLTPPPARHAAPVAKKLRIYSHSDFFYWWPVWAVGYVMMFLTYWRGQPHEIGTDRELFHASSNLGVVYFATLFAVILITNFRVRGLASGVVILGGLLVTVFLAYMGWWDEIFVLFGALKIHMNMGAYLWFSTLLFSAWSVSVFVFDRMSYWLVEPGQVTHVHVLGAGSKSYNTQGMMLEKHRDDLFQNWLLGLGSGNLVIRTSGATREQIDVPNVLFIGWKVAKMQHLIASEPEDAAGA